jgi:uncharacterized C2H2 Zn-finger protein
VGGQSFKCPKCDKWFLVKGALKDHLQGKHEFGQGVEGGQVMSMRTQAMIDAVIKKLATATLGGNKNVIGIIEDAIEDLKALKREDMKREN